MNVCMYVCVFPKNELRYQGMHILSTQVRNRRKHKGIFSIDSHCVMVMRLMVTFASILGEH